MNLQKILRKYDPSSSIEVGAKLILQYIRYSVYFYGFGNIEERFVEIYKAY